MTVKQNYFTEKIAVITGGSRGLGKAVAEALVQSGCKVVIGDILDYEGEETVKELNHISANSAMYLHTNVTVYKDVIALFKLAESEFGGVEIAFLNAGVACRDDSLFSPLEDESDEKIADVNFIGVIRCTRVALLHMAGLSSGTRNKYILHAKKLLHMAKRGGGVTVNTASVVGLRGNFALAQYTATKHAVIGWTRSLNLLKDHVTLESMQVCMQERHMFIKKAEPNCYLSLSSLDGKDTEIRMNFIMSGKDKGGPMTRLFDQSPIVKMDAAVNATLTLMKDSDRNAQSLIVLPPVIVRAQEAPTSFPEEVRSKNSQTAKEHRADVLAYYKLLLKEAWERYEA